MLMRAGLLRFFIYFKCNHVKKSFHQSTTQVVRVRFAPSPTGYLHLGGLRTALYNYLFARQMNGKFILRIEDTDQSRCVEGAMEKLCGDLDWAGIVADEGPLQGGPFGPYIQSHRVDIYRAEVKKLLENGSAYYCFCTERRLDLLRKDALKSRQVPKYDNRCRHLTPGQIAEKLAKQDTFCIRFKLDPIVYEFNDLIYGTVKYDVTNNEGDPIIIKSDGFPTYHFANVVDDHFMQITHVLRGVEWQISTTKHLSLYQAFGWIPPQYGHLPLLINSDGTKLSKRQGNVNIDEYKLQGIEPLALINFITQTGGGGFNQDSSTITKSYRMDELQAQFNIERLNSHPSKLNPLLLEDCNRMELQTQFKDPQKHGALIAQLKSLILEKYSQNVHQLDLDDRHIHNVLQWALKRITKLSDLVGGSFAFLWTLPKRAGKSGLNTVLNDELIGCLEACNSFDKHTLQLLLKSFATKHDLNYAEFMQSLRSLLCGLKEGPGVAEMMEILGKDTTLQRIQPKKLLRFITTAKV